MNIRSLLSLTTVALLASWLVACGSGSSVSGAGGGSSGGSSNLVVNVGGGTGTAYVPGRGSGNTMLASLSDFLISRAEASEHLAENVVTVWDSGVLVATGETDGNGQVAFNVEPNDPEDTYTVCVNLPEGGTPTSDPERCEDLMDPVTESDVLTVNVEETMEGIVVVDTASSGPTPAEESIGSFEDEDHPGPNTKILVCHKPEGPNPHTLSISENAVDAHLNHGDQLDACPSEGTSTASNDEEEEEEEDEDEET